MAGIAAAIIGAGVIGAGASIYAANRQTQAAQAATNAQLGMFNTARQGQQPFIQAGQAALPTLQKLLTPGPSQTETLAQLPGFQFASEWGQRGVANQATTTGLGGNTLAAGAEFATGLASQNWAQLVSQLQNLGNMGANAASNVGSQAVNVGGQVGSNIIGAGNAQAGAATAVGANVGNSLTTAALLQRLGNNTPMSMYGTGTPNSPNAPFYYGDPTLAGFGPTYGR